MEWLLIKSLTSIKSTSFLGIFLFMLTLKNAKKWENKNGFRCIFRFR